jgi:hypothetical protein
MHVWYSSRVTSPTGPQSALQGGCAGLQLSWLFTHFPSVSQLPRLPSLVHAAPAAPW